MTGHHEPTGSSLPPALDPRGRRAARRDAGARTGGGRRGTHRVVVGVRVLAAVMSLAILVGSGYAWATYQKFSSDIATGGDLPTTSTPDVDGTDQNILLIGSDSRLGATPEELQQLATQDDGGAVNTDTMILLHVPADGSRASLISFPRDSYVDIPGYPSDRINAAYSDAYAAAITAGDDEVTAESAGIALTAATISQLTGLTIDHYLQVNLLGFYRISIAIGGVDVCLNEAQQDPYSGIDLPAGITRNLKGTQALAFVRQRHGLPRGDLDRIARQQYFLGAVFRKVSSGGVLLNPFKLSGLLSAVSSSLLKDESLNLLDLAKQVQDLQAGNITFATIPTTGDKTIDGKDVLGVDPAEVQSAVQQIIANTSAAVASAPTVAPGSFTVDVLNGGAPGGSASTASQALAAAGYGIGTVGDADQPVQATQIQFPAGMASQARTLALAVPQATFVESSAVQGVTLVLGPDGVGVTAPSDQTTTAPPTAGASPAQTGSASDIPCIN